MSEDENNEPIDNGQEQEQQTNTSEVANKNSQKESTKKVNDFVNKFSKNKAGNRALVKALAKILITCGWVLLIFIIAVGIIMFFLTMPGMVMEKLKGLFKAIANDWCAWWGGDTTTQIDKVEVYNVLNYLDEMGYDLKGYGFITEYLTDPENNYDQGGAEGDPVPLKDRKLTADGVIRDGDDKVITGVSDFIMQYLISENYIYTIKNNNLVTDWWLAPWEHFKDLFSSDMKNKRGMLAFYHDTGVIGFNSGNDFDESWWDNISIDAESKKLSIKNGWFNSSMEYGLDGWTGRYGMPVDFLLTVHLATQMPDLAYDMTKEFNTEVRILLHTTSGDVFGAYKLEDGTYIDTNVLESKMGNFERTGNGLLDWIVNIEQTFDDLIINDDEAKALIDLGIIPPSHNPKEASDDDDDDDDDGCGCKYEMNDGKREWTELSDNCKGELKDIIGYLKNPNDGNYSTYAPYIENVTNHWFRDIYYVVNENDSNNGKEFVDYDYQYELITGERWTLYETYTSDQNDGDLYNPEKEGQFVYYKLNDDGTTGERYDGNVLSGEFVVKDDDGNTQKDKDGNVVTERLASRGEDGTLVVKKAKMIKLSDKFADLGWNYKDGVYSAYDFNTSIQNEYQEMFPEDKLKEEIKKDGKAKYEDALKRMYIQMHLPTITQTGEGLRTETNPKIKKMFMSNKYFKYDGSRQRAEIIYALRNFLNTNYGYSYGAISQEILDKVSELNNGCYLMFGNEYTTNPKEDFYNLEDYIGSVSFEQDALNTFAMLENSHTLDADYIYKDFKELVVELGYFKKEELTESKPKILQWIVPEIASGGYPDRSIDKREEEYGTLIHSKADIDANKQQTLTAIYKKAAQEKQSGERDENIQNGAILDSKTNVSAISGNETSLTGNVGMIQTINSNVNITQIVGSMGSDFERIAEEGDGYEYKVKTGSVEYTHYYQFMGSYAEETFSWSGQTCTLHAAACGPTSCINILTGYGQDVNPSKDIVGIQFDATTDGVGKFMEEHGVKGKVYHEPSEFKARIEEAFSEGRPIITLMNNANNGFWTSEGHFVPMIGQDSNGNIITLDPGSSSPERHTYTGGVDGLLLSLVGLWVADEPPSGGMTQAKAYEGYKGNEAVVSPVTGILMEYGTYDAEEAEENRENIDMKYGGLIEGYEFEKETVVDPETGEKTEEIKYPSDQVGYAVIKILDAETYKKLESTVTNRWNSTQTGSIDNQNVNNSSLVEINEKSENYEYANKHVTFKEDTEELLDEHRNWTNIEETVYGYKEFAEQYEQFGIGGYYIYIDGFKCESVGDVNESTQEVTGEALTLDSFKVSEADVNNDDYEYKTETKYKKDEVSKLVSEYYYNKLKAEAQIKSDASIGITFKYSDLEVDQDGKSSVVENEYILIKEGTVLGRTLTDKELVEGADYRNSKYGTCEEYKKAQSGILVNSTNNSQDNDDETSNKIPLMGNYLRLIMEDQDGSIVENVEDYLKIDEGKFSSANTIGDIEQFMFWQATEPEGFEYIMNGQTSYALTLTSGGKPTRIDNPSDKYGHSYAIDGEKNNDINLCPGIYLGSGSGREIFKEVVGNENIGYGIYVTGEQNLEIYTKELEVCRQTIIDTFPVTADWDENDTRMFALMDVSYAGMGNFQIGTMYNKLKNGDTNLTKEDFLSNCTSENPFYTQNPNGFTRRRLIDYYMYSEGIFAHGVYDGSGTDVKQRWEFTSETPFQDLMMDKTPAKLVDL